MPARPLPSSWTPAILGLLRITTAYMFLLHGTAKLFGTPHVAYFDQLQLFSLVGFAGVLEIVGSILLLIGLFTRPTAFVLSGLAAFAYFIGHASKGFVLAPMMNGGESAALFSFVFLLLAVAGPGRFSLDGKRAAS